MEFVFFFLYDTIMQFNNYILWHIDQLAGNELEISYYTRVIAK
jgi:hypothetical protein